MLKPLTIVAYVLTLMFTMCAPTDDENHHYYLYVKNEANHAIFVTDENSIPYSLMDRQNSKVNPGETNCDALFDLDWTWENRLSSSRYGDTARIYIFHADTLELMDLRKLYPDKSSEELKSHAIMRYDLTLKDLQKLNWHLTYPPTQEMREMKIVQDSITYRDYRR